MKPYFVLTGGPGSGKSTVINELKRRGYSVVKESGRRLLQKLIAEKGEEWFRQNLEVFRDTMFHEDLKSLQHAADEITFFDRGFIDSLGYSKLMGIPIPPEMESLAQKHGYHPKVFAFPPWEEIYCHDADRKQTFEEAIATYNHVIAEYQRLEYEIIEVPKSSVEDRVKFILNVTIKPRF